MNANLRIFSLKNWPQLFSFASSSSLSAELNNQQICGNMQKETPGGFIQNVGQIDTIKSNRII